MMADSSRRSAAHEKLSRSVMWGLLAMALLSLAGPVLSFFIDQNEVEEAARARALQSVQLHADALSLRLRMMEAELERLARRPEVNFADASREPEEDLLELTHSKSALFGGGVALFNHAGHVISSIPKERFSHTVNYSNRSWFQKALRLKRSVSETLEESPGSWILLVPIKRGGKLLGFVSGIVESTDHALTLSVDANQSMALVDGDDILLRAPSWPKALPDNLFQAETNDFQFMPSGKHVLAFSAHVRDSLKLWMLVDIDRLLLPVRQRLLWQLLFLIALQVIIFTGFFLYVRKTYQVFREMEMRLVDEEKMARLGSASTLIAHEIKNTLNAISAAFSFQKNQNPVEDLSLRVVKSQMSRLSHLGRSLLSLGRPIRPQKTLVSLNEAIQEPLEALQILPEFSNVNFHFEAIPSVPLHVDPALLATAVDNVLRNAIEASVAQRDVGKIEQPQVRVVCTQRSDFVRLTVEDNGGGIPTLVKEQLFEPFVTSKPKGVGLGLTTTRQAMEAMGGSIHYEPTPDGSRFHLDIPLGPENHS